MTSNQEVEEFLAQLRLAIAEGRYQLVPRKKNLDDIARLGLSVRMAKSIVIELAPEDYLKGPEWDLDGSEGDVWVFGKIIEETQIYIKLKLEKGNVKVLSFHVAERRLKRPLGDKGADS